MEKSNINQLPDNNPMPEIHLFRNAKDVAMAIGSTALNYVSLLSFLPRKVLSTHSDHQRTDEEIAERMMDNPEAQEAFEQLKIEFEGEQQ